MLHTATWKSLEFLSVLFILFWIIGKWFIANDECERKEIFRRNARKEVKARSSLKIPFSRPFAESPFWHPSKRKNRSNYFRLKFNLAINLFSTKRRTESEWKINFAFPTAREKHNARMKRNAPAFSRWKASPTKTNLKIHLKTKLFFLLFFSFALFRGGNEKRNLEMALKGTTQRRGRSRRRSLKQSFGIVACAELAFSISLFCFNSIFYLKFCWRPNAIWFRSQVHFDVILFSFPFVWIVLHSHGLTSVT